MREGALPSGGAKTWAVSVRHFNVFKNPPDAGVENPTAGSASKRAMAGSIAASVRAFQPRYAASTVGGSPESSLGQFSNSETVSAADSDAIAVAATQGLPGFLTGEEFKSISRGLAVAKGTI